MENECRNVNYYMCHYYKRPKGKLCINGNDCSWCKLKICPDCNETYCSLCMKNNICNSCESKKEKEQKCKFCSKNVLASDNNLDSYNSYGFGCICNICDKFICKECYYNKKMVETKNFDFFGCIDCFVKETKYMDYLYSKISDNFKSNPGEFFKKLLQ